MFRCARCNKESWAAFDGDYEAKREALYKQGWADKDGKWL